MSVHILKAIPILPAADIDASITWWTAVCGFTVAFRQGGYAGLMRDGAYVHLSQMSDPILARTVGDQTMVRFIVNDIDALYADYQQRGGAVHPNGALQTKPWGTREFGALDPNGVCISFTSET